MADLPNFADRMNDVEIAANAPLTETLMRKYGSNINLLLDFLGIADGTTSASGTLSDLINAVNFIDTNSMTQQASFTPGGPGTFSVGTYTQTKFVNQVFYIHIPSGSPAFTWGAGNNRMLVNIDSGGNTEVAQSLAPVALTSTLNGYASDHQVAYLVNQGRNTGVGSGDDQIRDFSKLLNVGDWDAVTGPSATQSSLLLPCFELDYRDSGASFDVLFQHPGSTFNGVNIQIYRDFRLVVGSAGF